MRLWSLSQVWRVSGQLLCSSHIQTLTFGWSAVYKSKWDKNHFDQNLFCILSCLHPNPLRFPKLPRIQKMVNKASQATGILETCKTLHFANKSHHIKASEVCWYSLHFSRAPTCTPHTAPQCQPQLKLHSNMALCHTAVRYGAPQLKGMVACMVQLEVHLGVLLMWCHGAGQRIY